jgi:hypothetical protein
MRSIILRFEKDAKIDFKNKSQNQSQNYKYKSASTSTQGAQSSKATNGEANLVKIRAVRMSEKMTGY